MHGKNFTIVNVKIKKWKIAHYKEINGKLALNETYHYVLLLQVYDKTQSLENFIFRYRDSLQGNNYE